MNVDRGVEVVVTGYQGEPYLRFSPDGPVQRNRRSPATYVNNIRTAAVEVPGSADPEAEPDWEIVAGGGAYAWHDHRIHWMGSDRPAGAEPGEWTKSWTVDIVVDGTPTRIDGTLALLGGINPLPWVVLALAATAAVVVAGRRRPLTVAPVAARRRCWPAASAGPSGRTRRPAAA